MSHACGTRAPDAHGGCDLSHSPFRRNWTERFILVGRLSKTSGEPVVGFVHARQSPAACRETVCVSHGDTRDTVLK